MSKRVLILDTSVLCCWLQVPSKEEAGTVEDRWTHERIDQLLREEQAKHSTFVLPIATLIETGNHIAQVKKGDRFNLANKLAEYLRKAADAHSPWAAFTEQAELWQTDNLRTLAENWPAQAAQRLSIGDATIKDVAEYYHKAGFSVEILTGDKGLKAYEPASSSAPVLVPRRRKH